MVLSHEWTLAYTEPGFLPGSTDAAWRIIQNWSTQDICEAISDVRRFAPNLNADQRCLLAFLEEARERRKSA